MLTLETTEGREKKAKFSPLTKLSQNYILTCLKGRKKQTKKKAQCYSFLTWILQQQNAGDGWTALHKDLIQRFQSLSPEAFVQNSTEGGGWLKNCIKYQDGDLLRVGSKDRTGKQQVSEEKQKRKAVLKRLEWAEGCGVDCWSPWRIENQKWNFELDAHLRGIDWG